MMQAEPSQSNSSEGLNIQEKLKNKDITLLNCDLGDNEGSGAYGRILVGMKTGVIQRYLALKWIDQKDAKQIELGALSEYIKYHKGQTNLITVHDVWGGTKDDDFLCYSMDLADDAKLGRAVETREEISNYKPDTLQLRMHDGGAKRVLPLETINHYVMELLDGLEHLEKLGLVHRDIKPANVLFLSGNAVLGDLGCMVRQDTEVWCGAGTWSYMSAEQRTKNKIDKCYCHEDLYQLGEVIYRMCLDLRVKAHQNYCHIVGRMDDQLLPPMKPPLMEVPGILTAYEAKLVNAFVTMHACATKPERRFQSVAEFRASWNEVMENSRDPEREARLRRQKTLGKVFRIGNVFFLILIFVLVTTLILVKQSTLDEPTLPALKDRRTSLLCAEQDMFGRTWEREFINGVEWFDPLAGRLDNTWEVSSEDRRSKLPSKATHEGGARELELFWKGKELPPECEVRFYINVEAPNCKLMVDVEPIGPPSAISRNVSFECLATPEGFFEAEDFVDADKDMVSGNRFQIDLVVRQGQINGKVFRQVKFDTSTLTATKEVPEDGNWRLRIRLSSQSKGEVYLGSLMVFKPIETPPTDEELSALWSGELSAPSVGEDAGEAKVFLGD